MAKRNGQLGWYVTFVAVAVIASIGVWAFTGQDAVAAAARLLWNGLALVINVVARVLGSLLALLAKGVGWRRLSRVANVICGIGLGYAGSVVLSDEKVQQARTWRSRLRTIITIARSKWQALPVGWKLFVVAVLIVSQIYVHTLLIIFPVAFLVPVVQRLWVRIADLAFGSWYWRYFGSRHRSLVSRMRRLPIVSGLIGWVRLTRIRYLTAWRLWRYHPRYRLPGTTRRKVSLGEPIRLWWRCELDSYVGRPLLAGRRQEPACAAANNETRTSERGWTSPVSSITLSSAKSMAQRDA